MDRQWTLIQQCWDEDPRFRPRALRIASGLCVLTPKLRTHRPDLFLTCSGVPAWKRMIELPLASDEQISLITDIFSDPDESEVVKCLRGNDAQSFVDVIEKVLHSFDFRGYI